MNDDLFTRIKQDVPPENHDLTTAEGRYAWDCALRDWLKDITPEGLRMHLGQMVKNWRREVLGFGSETEATYISDLRNELALMRSMLEAAMENFPAKEGVMKRRLEEIRAKREDTP